MQRILRTEDTGKMLEMGICLAYNIPYNGPYRYSMDVPQRLKPRLEKLKNYFPMCNHTAGNGARYDYTSVENTHLSAKSTKKGVGKVAPQVIGQAQPEYFCQVLQIPYSSVPDLKKHIQENIASILPRLSEHTFDCPNVFYNAEKDTIRYIVLNTPIDWSRYVYQWSRPYDSWNNSSTLRIQDSGGKFVSLAEFQFHSAGRTNMAIRWCYENFLTFFRDHLTIHEL